MATESADGAAIDGLRRIVRAVAWLLRASLIAAAALMLACIAIQVVMRYVFGRTPSWSEEVAILMFAWRRFGGRVTARNMILAAAMAGLLRFTVMAFNPPVEVLFLTQTLHAFSFGMGYFGVVHFIANWTNEANAAEAQGFANMLNMGAAMLALIVFGILFEHFGSYAFFYSTITASAAIGCVLVSLRLKPPKDAQ